MKNKIGLELHIQLKTKSKLFSASPVSFSNIPNSTITSYDWACPGSLPQTNKQAVVLAIQTAYLLHCDTPDYLIFDRKNYYYFDLPKGYQITQFQHPIGKNGQVKILLPDTNQTKIINISAVQIEEDTAKSIYKNDNILVDYNRCGVALLEIITEPDFTNYQDVESFLKKIIRILQRHNISEAKFSSGSIRVDLNVSTSLDGHNFCARSEIKNLNSFINIKKALHQEIVFQKTYFHKLDKKSYTKNYDEKLKKLVVLRSKFSQYDYFFMPENNLAPFHLSAHFKKYCLRSVLAFLDWEDKFIDDNNLSFVEADWLLNKPKVIPFFQKIKRFAPNDNQTIFLFLKEIVWPFGEKHRFQLANFNFTLAEKLLQRYQTKKINFKMLKSRFLQNDFNSEKFNEDFQTQSTTLNLQDKQIIINILENLVTTDDQIITNYFQAHKSTLKYLMGLIMPKVTKSSKPQLIIAVIDEFFQVKKNF